MERREGSEVHIGELLVLRGQRLVKKLLSAYKFNVDGRGILRRLTILALGNVELRAALRRELRR